MAPCPIQASNVIFLLVIDDARQRDPVMDNITDGPARKDGGLLE